MMISIPLMRYIRTKHFIISAGKSLQPVLHKKDVSACGKCTGGTGARPDPHPSERGSLSCGSAPPRRAVCLPSGLRSRAAGASAPAGAAPAGGRNHISIVSAFRPRKGDPISTAVTVLGIVIFRPRKEDPMGETAARFPPWPGGGAPGNHSEGSPGDPLVPFPSWGKERPAGEADPRHGCIYVFLENANYVGKRKVARQRQRRNGPHRLRNRGYRKGRDPLRVFGHSSSLAQSARFGPRYVRNECCPGNDSSAASASAGAKTKSNTAA